MLMVQAILPPMGPVPLSRLLAMVALTVGLALELRALPPQNMILSSLPMILAPVGPPNVVAA
jgi:hypothetical protein